MERTIGSNNEELIISWTVTSGSAVMIWFSAVKELFFLNSKSPRDRDRANLPEIQMSSRTDASYNCHQLLTRPLSTYPPAAYIRAFSAENILSDLYSVFWSVQTGLTFVVWLVI